jgi:hypothetical protein
VCRASRSLARRAVDQGRVQHGRPADLERGDLVGVGLEGGGLEVALRTRQRLRGILAGRPEPTDAAQDEVAGHADQVEHRVAGGHDGPGRAAAAPILRGLGRIAQASVLRVDRPAGAAAVLGADHLVAGQTPPAARHEPRPAEHQEAGRARVVGAVHRAERQVGVDRGRRVGSREERAGRVGGHQRDGRRVGRQPPPLRFWHGEHGVGQRAATARRLGPSRRR